MINNTSHPRGDHLSGQPTPLPDITNQPTLVIGAVSLTSRTPKQHKRRRSRKRTILFCFIGLFLLAISLSSVGWYLYQDYNTQYHQDLGLAREGAHLLQTAEVLIKGLTQGSFDSQKVTQARQEFAKAFTDFKQIENDLKQIPGIATIVPKYGNVLSSTLKLVPLAVEVSQVGMVGCDAIIIAISHLNNSLNVKAQGLTIEDLTNIKKDVAEIQGILNIATGQVNQLRPSDLQIDPRIGPLITTFRTQMPNLHIGLQDIQSVLSAAPALLGIGQPASFLIEQLDSTEVRPGGGFIGSYGIATFSGGRLANIQMRDTYLFDKPYEYSGHSISYPSAYKWFSDYLAPASWSLRDSNLDADFPTAAGYAEQIYHTEGGTVPLQGVIAVTPWLIENALKITGPIYVPEYQETITAQNLVDRIHFHQLKEDWKGGDAPSPDGHSSLRKRFTELLFEHFFARVRQIAPTTMPRFVSLLRDSLYSKDIQIYFNSSTAENVLQRYQLASTILAPRGDSLFVVDADVSGGKPNNFIHYTLQDEVTIDASGNAIHKTTLIYNWPVGANPFQNGFGYQSLYHDYVRIYAPLGSNLLMQGGWQQRGTSIAFGHEIWAGLFMLPYGQSRTITLSWAVHGAAIHDVHGWHYHNLVQRQAGIMWHLNLQVMLPACAHTAGSVNKMAFSNQQDGTLSQDITRDFDIEINYLC